MLAYLSGLDFAAIALVVATLAGAIHTGRRLVVKVRGVEATLGEVSSAVNNVDPNEDKLIDKVRGVVESVAVLERQGRAQHIATVALDTTLAMHGDRLSEVGRKADVAQKSAARSERLISEYIARDESA